MKKVALFLFLYFSLHFLRIFGENSKSIALSVLEYEALMCFGDDVIWVQHLFLSWKLYTEGLFIFDNDSVFYIPYYTYIYVEFTVDSKNWCLDYSKIVESTLSGCFWLNFEEMAECKNSGFPTIVKV